MKLEFGMRFQRNLVHQKILLAKCEKNPKFKSFLRSLQKFNIRRDCFLIFYGDKPIALTVITQFLSVLKYFFSNLVEMFRKSN